MASFYCGVEGGATNTVLVVPTFPVIPYELRLNVLSAAPLALVRLAKPKVVISTHSLDG